MAEEILSVQPLSKIVCYDKPPQFGGKASYLTPQEVEKKFGIKLTEGMYAENKTIAEELKKAEFQQRIDINYSDLQKKLKQRLKKPFDGLSLGFINEQIGYATFAEKDFPADTVLGIYSGLVVKATEKINTNFDYLAHLIDDFYVGAGEFRGFGGFMPHLPADHDRDEEKLVADTKDPKKLAQLMKMDVNFIESEMKYGRLNNEFVETTMRATMQRPRTNDTEFADIEFLNKEIRNSIASANIDRVIIPYEGTYVIALITKHAIKKGEMIGFTYTQQYWNQSERTPEIFSKYGKVVPHSLYKRHSHLSLNLQPATDKKVKVEDHRSAFLTDVVNNKPVDLGNSGYASIYDIREELIRTNAVGEHYGKRPDNSIALQLKEKFKDKDISVNLFWSKPRNIDNQPRQISSYSADIVCRAKNEAGLAFLTEFFARVHNHTKKFTETNEVVLLDVNASATQQALRSILK